MKRGPNPPSPQDWVDRLPVLDPETPPTGWAIIDPRINGVKYLLVYISATTLTVYQGETGENHWFFNVETGWWDLSYATGSGFATKIIEETGIQGRAPRQSRTSTPPTLDKVVGKYVAI